VSDKSLQVSETRFDVEIQYRRKPDVSNYDLGSSSGLASSPSASSPVAVLPLLDYYFEEDDLTGINIYEFHEGKLPGRLVTRIELLSPANKPPQSFHPKYMFRRAETLRAGVCLVEIDYLHELSPLLPELGSYPRGDNTAFPYIILVSNPHPSFEQGKVEVYGFRALDEIPKVAIPLSGEDTVTIDFGAVYNASFGQVRVFRIVSDYAQDPPHFDRYTETDRAKIRALLDEIRRQHAEQVEGD
jgi:hypothetical protein